MDEKIKRQIKSQLDGLRNEITAKHKQNLRCHWNVGESLNYLRLKILENLDADEMEIVQKTVHPLEFEKPEPGDLGIWLIEGSEAYKLLSQLDALIGTTAIASKKPTPTTANKSEWGKKVFIVHGHNEVAKSNLEIFLSEIGLEPILLHRQADEGFTIIEKWVYA